MTPRTPQCEVFWALLSNPKHSGVPEDSKSLTLGVLGFTPTLGKSGVAIVIVGFMYAMFATIISNVESYMVSSVSLMLNECFKSYKFPPNL